MKIITLIITSKSVPYANKQNAASGRRGN